MRIAVVNSLGRIAGGIETYLDVVIPAFEAQGHEIGFWYEFDEPANHAPIDSGHGTRWCVTGLGEEIALDSLERWRPDVLYLQNLSDVHLENRVTRLAPTVYFAHQYHGTCMSGNKAFRYPTARPCSRQFGLPCLLLYYPRRCGGLNPATMVRAYRDNRNRLRSMAGYTAVVTHSAPLP